MQEAAGDSQCEIHENRSYGRKFRKIENVQSAKNARFGKLFVIFKVGFLKEGYDQVNCFA